MGHPALKPITVTDYLEMERSSVDKHEYFEGHVLAMAGASTIHNRIVANIVGELHRYLKGKNCNVYPSDLRVTTPFSSSYMYPDVSLICGEPALQHESPDVVINPSVIIEVMSPSTEDNDRGFKFFRYMQIPTVREYILVNTAKYEVEIMRRQNDNSWLMTTVTGLDSIMRIDTIDLLLALNDVYYRVELNK